MSPTHFEVDVTLGVGPVKGRYEVDIRLSDLDEPREATLPGTARGALGSGGGQGAIRLSEAPEDGTTIHYEYSAQVGGKVASVGGRMLDGAAKMVIGQFFQKPVAQGRRRRREAAALASIAWGENETCAL